MDELPQVTLSEDREVVFRAADPVLGRLLETAFSRYPQHEWVSFIRCGWRVTSQGLVLTLAAMDPPLPGDMDEEVPNVLIRDSYSLRIAKTAETHPLAVGLVHSHPTGYRPIPSLLDDDMDTYYGERYLRGFAPNRPYVSLIVSAIGRELAVSGRVFWTGRWHAVQRVLLEGILSRTWVNGRRPASDDVTPDRVARLASAFGKEAAARLRRATVAVIGAGGTGSAAIETLARAGVGRLIVVDPDHLEDSNLERVHGSLPHHAAEGALKVAIAREHVNAIAPECEVISLKGALPQPEVVDLILGADAVLGCTDTQHSRLALSDLAARYLVPSIDVGVALEGEGGKITAQIMQLRRFLAADPCARCRKMISQWRLNQELMTTEDRMRRRDAAIAARADGRSPDAYWRDEPQLDTVGYLTTAAGALAAGHVIGWITGRFTTRSVTTEVSLLVPSMISTPEVTNQECDCARARGWADQGARYALVSPPSHWPEVARL